MSLFIKPEASNCFCPPMTGPMENPPNPPPAPKNEDKYFHEVGAEMIDNHLIIRMEKDKSRKKKSKLGNWEPPCDCDVVEIKRPTKKSGPKIVNGGDNNQILFRIHSKAHLNKKEDPHYKPQAVAYKINRCGREDDHCRKITIYPQLGGPITQDVFTDHITDDDQDIYLLRVKKKNDAMENSKKRNLEVELRTPKPPPPPPKPVVPEAAVKPSNGEVEKTEEESEKNTGTEKSKNNNGLTCLLKKNGKNGKNGKNRKNGKKQNCN